MHASRCNCTYISLNEHHLHRTATVTASTDRHTSLGSEDHSGEQNKLLESSLHPQSKKKKKRESRRSSFVIATTKQRPPSPPFRNYRPDLKSIPVYLPYPSVGRRDMVKGAHGKKQQEEEDTFPLKERSQKQESSRAYMGVCLCGLSCAQLYMLPLICSIMGLSLIETRERIVQRERENPQAKVIERGSAAHKICTTFPVFPLQSLPPALPRGPSISSALFLFLFFFFLEGFFA
ncbi:hypothetical protein V8C37DRAFT_375287 [Trichoderma ceciliae]